MESLKDQLAASQGQVESLTESLRMSHEREQALDEREREHEESMHSEREQAEERFNEHRGGGKLEMPDVMGWVKGLLPSDDAGTSNFGGNTTLA